jgi:Ni,Fe-hydrogenase III small subunit
VRSDLLSRFNAGSCESVYLVTTGNALFDFDIGPFAVKVSSSSRHFAAEVWTGMIRLTRLDRASVNWNLHCHELHG